MSVVQQITNCVSDQIDSLFTLKKKKTCSQWLNCDIGKVLGHACSLLEDDLLHDKDASR